MKKSLLFLQLMTIAVFSVFAQTPLSMNGQLKLVGNQLSNACGDPVQLRGLSTHAPMGHQDCYTQSSIQSMAQDWGADIIRLAMYTDVDNGSDYLDNPTNWDNWIDQMVDYAEDNGMYVMIDWHILKDNDPFIHINEAKTFFQKMSNKYKDRDHVLYEICNEPNGGVNWNRIRDYANQIIPIIRANDPENIIIVGTPQWSSRPGDVSSNPLPSANRYNVMYAFHFYAGSHYDYGYLQNVLGSLPVFVTEWGTTDASGNGGFNSGSSDTWLGVLNGNNNGGQKVSSCNWTFSDKNESSAVLNPGACATQSWTNRTQSGNYVYNYLNQPDNFTQCQALADDDGDGVINKDDKCPNTPNGDYVDANGCTAPLVDNDNDGIADDGTDECLNTPPGTTVNLYGCEIVHSFVNNSCHGVNNYQGYARDDFEQPFYENMTWWSTDGTNPVYDAGVSGGEMVVDVTGADPNFQTFGMSFDEDDEGNLVTIDISHHPVLKMDVRFEPSGGYSSNTVLFEVHIEDDNGLELSTDALQNLHRPAIPVNQWVTVTMDFTDGYYELYDNSIGCSPCYQNNTTFDYSRLTKVQMWVNPGAGETWSRPQFNGTWRIDNFSIGYDDTSDEPCDPFRDDDKDGIAVEVDQCPNTPTNETADATGCSASQLDSDGDGVNNLQDACSNTPNGAIVDDSGCSDAQRDDDGDGILNPNDLCADTPIDETVDADGCSDSQLDDDNDGVPNSEDACPGEDDTQDLDNDDIPDACDNDDDGDNITDDVDCDDRDALIGAASVWYEDSDNDGFGDANSTKTECTKPTGYVDNAQDQCPTDINKIAPGTCGCNVVDGTCEDCNDEPFGNAIEDECGKCIGGTTGETSDDGDNDGVLDCNDDCPNTLPGTTVDSKGCLVTGLNDLERSGVSVYPVPTEDKLTIEQKGITYSSANIISITGNTVMKLTLNSAKEEISLQGLASGMYFIELTGGTATKIIKIQVK